MTDIIKLKDAAEKLGVSPATVINYIKRGALIALRSPGGHYSCSSEAIDKFRKDMLAESKKPTIPTGARTRLGWGRKARSKNV